MPTQPRENSTPRATPPNHPVLVYDEGSTAAHFNRRFEKRGRREKALVKATLSDFPHSAVLIDIACGALRFLPIWSHHTSLVVACDRSPAMIEEACRTIDAVPTNSLTGLQTTVQMARADAFCLPFADRSADTIACLRLLHHFSEASEIHAILSELRRVTRGIVLTSFFDSRSFQHLRRLVRQRGQGRPSQRYAMTRSRFVTIAREAHLEVFTMRSVVRGFSEQTVVGLSLA